MINKINQENVYNRNSKIIEPNLYNLKLFNKYPNNIYSLKNQVFCEILENINKFKFKYKYI